MPEDACRKLSSLFAAETLRIRKRTKKGETELDLSANTREIVFAPLSGHELRLEAVISAQQPSVNPGGLSEAIGLYAPALRPDYSHFRRLEVYDGELSVFR